MDAVEIDVAPLIETEKKEPEPTTCNDRVVTWLANPKIILFLSMLFFISYISFICAEGGFSKQFLHFGPGTSDQNTALFLGLTLDTWPRVIVMYFAGFFSSLMQNYYSSAMQNNLYSYVWNRAIKEVPFSKRWTYVIIVLEPFFYQLLYIIGFFTSLTMQLQFIIPQFIGSFIIDVPFSLQRLADKKFAYP
jgi:hypothetical protein